MDDDLRALRDVAAPDGVERDFGVRGVLAALGVRKEPVRCGRYELRDKLGEGAMGVVYRARDPDLDRLVALKLLRDPADARAGDVLREEGRALARLSHPHVVQVLGVGREDGRTWIAMEMVEGTTLAQWAQANPPGTVPRFVAAQRMLVAAGRGLWAAHRAGLVHRDFKPANVLVRESDGLVKVADFGLARPELLAETLEGPLVAAARADLDDDAASRGLTRTGALVGTPRYMSPEQHRGQSADARSDQFCFAVSAWEVIYGEPPFAAASIFGLLEAIESGALPDPEVDGVPSGVRDVLARALSPDPADRYPSMRELLRELKRRRGGLSLVALGLLAAGGVVWWAAAADPTATGPRCDGTEARAELAAVWSPARADAVAGAMRRTDVAFADTAARAVGEAIDDFGTRWVAQHVAACEATWHREVASETELDTRVQCLRGELHTVDAFVDRLLEADAKLVERAPSAAFDLPAPETCEHPDPRDADEDSETGGRLRAQLDRANAAQLAADYATAQRQAHAVVQGAEAEGLDVLRGDALLVEGRAQVELGDTDAVQSLVDAYEIAIAHDHAGRATERARRIATFFAVNGQVDEAATWLRHAEAANERQGRPALASAWIERTRCQLLDAQGEYDAAYETCAAALATAQSLPSRDPYLAWGLQSRLAMLSVSRGHMDEAIEICRRLRDEAEVQLGPSHPRVGGMSLNLGNAAEEAGRIELAVDSYRRAIDVFRVAYGPDHGWVVSGYLNLGSAYMRARDHDAAQAALLEAVKLSGDRQDARTARVLHNLAELRRRQDRYEEASELLQRVRVIEAATLPPDSPQIATTHHTLGNTYLELGRYEDAARELAAARALRGTNVSGPDGARLWASLAELSDRTGDAAAALDYSRRAIEAFDTFDTKLPASLTERARTMNLLLDAGRSEEARTYLPDLAAIDAPEAPRAKVVLAGLQLAVARLHRIDGDEAAAVAARDEALATIAGLDDDRATNLRAKIETWSRTG